jgi:N-acetyl-anhydromuramyl-L-alanine amidase AmpD
MDTGRRADANLDANAFAISIETEDNGDPDNFPWSRAQLDSLRWLHAKLRAVHPTIPRRRCPGPPRRRPRLPLDVGRAVPMDAGGREAVGVGHVGPDP